MASTNSNCVTASETPKILVVDDESGVRDVLCRWFVRAGYRCAGAADAAAAWSYLQDHEVQLVTLDINMPGRSGLELLADVKRDFPETQVIMLTARGEPQIAIDALTHGAYGYLIKPAETEELLLQAARALEHRELLIARRRYTRDLETKVREQTLTIRRAHEETIHRLVEASMFRDEETGAHIQRVGLYSEVLAEALGWPAAEIDKLRMAAPMHDVGKIGIPDTILQKPGKLTDGEFKVMKTHTTIGAKMLSGSESPMLQMAQEIAFCHHERWDGTGYPQRLSGPFIPESARIVAIVDVYDALSHDRVYRPAMAEEKVLAILNDGRGTHFDPMLLHLFLGLLPEMRQIAGQNPDEERELEDGQELGLIGPAASNAQSPGRFGPIATTFQLTF